VQRQSAATTQIGPCGSGAARVISSAPSSTGSPTA
jgi:hypothetical protein